MDIRVTGEEDSREKTRELLIAISYFEPDKLTVPDAVPVTANGADKIAMLNGDRAEQHISELISISSTKSPDNKLSSCAFANHEV